MRKWGNQGSLETVNRALHSWGKIDGQLSKVLLNNLWMDTFNDDYDDGIFSWLE
jgi:hypothetical protein